MSRIIILLFLTSFWSCSQSQAPKILSPKENIKSLPIADIITETNDIDSIVDLAAFLDIDSIWIVGTENGIYVINSSNQDLIKYFKFNIKSHSELFDGQDSIVGFNTIHLTPNKDNSKLLIETSNGLVFQLNLFNYEIDWLVKFINRIETATYSEDGEQIAIGTRYNYKTKVGRSITEYYSSLFLINSKTGEYINHFSESASIKKVLFKDNDTKLLVAYDWNYTDTYLWDINQTDKSISQFREENAFLYDILILDENNFVSVNGNGISKWEFKTPSKKHLIYDDPNTGSEQLVKKLESGFVLIDYQNGLINPPTLKYLNNEIRVTDEFEFPKPFLNISLSKNPAVITGFGKRKESIYYFDLTEKMIIQTLDLAQLNKIINKG